MRHHHTVVTFSCGIILMPPNENGVTVRRINGQTMLSTGEAAEYIGMNENTLRYWRHLADGTGPKSFRVGKKLVFYAQDDLDEWLASQYESSVTA